MPPPKSRITKILKKLRAVYPDVKTQLRHKNPFELLVATILSAQCTDRQVNAVTPKLFSRFATPAELAAAPLKEIETLIHSTGFYHNKARHIRNCAAMLVAEYGGRVPDSLEELIRLPGVGRKTANVVLGAAFHIPGMVVDTHVARISGRLALTRAVDPVKIEFDLMELIPRTEWDDFSLRLIHLGREYCTARRPRCPECPLGAFCPFPSRGPQQGLV
ncbi:MAG: endonuclease III [Thermodesulfobacteriota bacterium]